jgi:hypothetical protein
MYKLRNKFMVFWFHTEFRDPGLLGVKACSLVHRSGVSDKPAARVFDVENLVI